MNDILHHLTERWLNSRGFSVVPTKALTQFDKNGASQPVEPPPVDAATDRYLRKDNPKLLELIERYGKLTVDASVHSLWTEKYIGRQMSLAKFRAHPTYVAAYGELPRPTLLKYFNFAQDTAPRAGPLFARLMEDARSAASPTTSRPLAE